VCDNTAVSAISPTALTALPDRAPVGRRTGLAILSAAILVAGIPLAGYAAMVLHHFYVSGAFFYDTGEIGALIWHSDLALNTPAVESGDSFYAIHLTPIFVLLSAISRLLPTTLQQFMAGFEGVSHALPALGVFWLLTGPFGIRSTAGIAVAAAVAIAFAFNGLALAIARYPHFELLIVAAVILFMVALRGGRPVWAILPFVVGLATREDAGFHFFALLAVMIALDWWYGIRLNAQKAAVAFAIAGLAYSLGAVIFQHAAFSNISGLSRIYLGNPPFGRITLDLLADRLRGYLSDRSYIVLPGMCAVVWAILASNPYIVAGYTAFLPWIALHFLADSDLAGSLSGYYAYPLMIASFWPLIGVLLSTDRIARPPSMRLSLLAFGGMIALSWTALPYQYNPGHLDIPESMLAPPSLAEQRATDQAMQALISAKATLSPLLADGSILALAPRDFARREAVEFAGSERPRTVIYFAGGYEAATVAAILTTAGLDHIYAVAGTPVRIASALPLPSSLGLTLPLVPLAPPR
jgi:hypothetical protein